MKSIVQIKVRYPETDRMGIVYHSNYYPWFELGRLDFIEKCSISYADMENIGLMMPVTETHCKYIHPCTFGDEVLVKTVLSKLTVARCRFDYSVLKDGVVIASGHTVHAFTDTTLKAINIKKKYPQLWQQINSVTEDKNNA